MSQFISSGQPSDFSKDVSPADNTEERLWNHYKTEPMTEEGWEVFDHKSYPAEKIISTLKSSLCALWALQTL